MAKLREKELRYKDENYIMMKKWIHQEDTITMNLYEPTTKQNNKTIRETNKSKIIVKHFNIFQLKTDQVIKVIKIQKNKIQKIKKQR